ncbi:hypothetical protein [Chitinophaga pinensis]|uniref:hypothetical protein n=1 Tax=Chitinophaga pinensis TaxID=79329 RepID=UPI0021BDAD7A|nr:hypothetical protein [Chitinophaga pinensis]
MYADGARIFVEVGPGKVLTGLTRAIVGKDNVLLHTEDAEPAAITHLLHTIAKYMATGRSVQLDKLFEDRNVHTINLNALNNTKERYDLACKWSAGGSCCR